MKIKLFTIPNMLTLANLLCGSVALIELLVYQNFVAAFILIAAAATFDFLDGAMARLLNQYSAIGVELDSLADVVSFGLVPSVAMFCLFDICQSWIDAPLWGQTGGYSAFLIVCFSALRLAKFNVSVDQKEAFIGLPTPANALFCLSVAALAASGKISLSAEVVVLISVVMAILLIVPLRLFALKFRSLGWRENRVRYIFLIVSAVALIFLREFSVPVVIAIYVLLSVVENISKRSKEAK